MLERLRARAAARAAARGPDAAPTSSTTSASWPPRASCSAPRSLTFARLCARSRRRPGVARRGRSGAVARERVVRPRCARRALARSPRSGRLARLRRRRRRAVRGAPALARRRPRASRARCATGRAAGARRRTPRSSPRSTRPTTGGWSGSGARRRGGLRRAALDALRAAPGRVGRAGRCSCTASTTSRRCSSTRWRRCPARRAEVCVSLTYEPGRAAFAGPRGDGRAAEAAGRAPRARLPDRSEHYAPAARAALHHLERRPVRARAPPACRPTARCGCSRRAASARRPSWSAAEVLELMREGVAPEDIAVLVRGGAGAGRGARAGAGRLRRAGQRSTARVAARPHAARRGRARRRPRRAPGGTAADVLTWLRTPGQLADAGRRRRARGACAPRGAHAPRAEAPAARAAPRSLSRSTRSPRRPPPGPEAFLDALVAEADAIWTAPHRRAAAVLGPDEAARRARGRRAALGRRASCARSPPRTRRWRRGPRNVLEALGAVAVREPAVAGRACWSPTRWRSARAASAPSSSAGSRTATSRAIPCPSRSSTTPTRRALARATGLVLPPPRGRARARALPALRGASRARRRCCSSPSARPTRRATRLQPSPFVDDVRALFTDELWEQRGRRLLAEVTWPPRDGADAARAAPGARGRASSVPDPPPLGAARAPTPVLAALGRARDRGGARAGDLRRLRRALARRERAAAAAHRAGPRADAARLARPRACSSGRCAACASATARRGSRPASLPPALEELRAAIDELRRAAAAHRGARRAARARGRPPALPAPRGRVRRRARAALPRVGLRRRARRARPARRSTAPASASPAASTASTSTPPAARVVRDYKGRDGHGRRALGAGPARSRPRCTRSPPASCSGSSRPARSTSRSAQATCARAGSCATTCRAAT